MQGTKLLQKKKKKNPLPHVKTTYSYHVFKCLISIRMCYLFEFKYFNYLY